MSSLRPAPWTWSLTLLALGAAALGVVAPAAAEALLLTRRGVGEGEVWRLLTAHLVHLNGVHLLWNVLPFLLLGQVYEPRLGPRRFAALVGGAALAVDLFVLAGAAGVEAYAGISGVATALFAAGAVLDLREASDPEAGGVDVAALVAPLLGLAFLAFKLRYEVTTGRYLFLDGHLPGVAVPVAHLAGTAVGVLVALGRGAPGRAIEAPA